MRRISSLLFGGLFMAVSWTTGATAAEDVPISMISYDGEKPVTLSFDDPLSKSIGVLFIDSARGKKFDPVTEGYATAFLISECHALTGMASVSTLPAAMRMPNDSRILVDNLTLGIGLKPGYEPTTLSRDAFSATWPVAIKRVLPDSLNKAGSMLSGWWLLQLEGCEPGAAGNGTPLAFDPVTSPELYAIGLPAKARHVGVLMTDQLSLVELPSCQILGQIRNIVWESTCSSWLGMHGGPVLTFDAARKTWVAIGMIPLGNPAAFLNPAGRFNSRGRSYSIYSVTDTNPRYFDYTTNIVPMAVIWPWIKDEVSGDHPGLIDPGRSGVSEPDIELRQLLLMQMQQRPEKDWSAADFTRFAIALNSLKYERDAVKLLKSALELDPTYLPAAFHLSRMIGWLAPRGISDQQLVVLRDALSSAIKAFPEDPQLILNRLHVEKRMAQFDQVIADGTAYVAASSYGVPGWLYVERGDAFLATGDLDKAEADFAQASKMDATDSEAFRGLAQIKLYRGDVAAALPLAEKSARLDPDSTFAGLVLALARAQGGDVDGAIAEAERVRTISPNAAIYAMWVAVLRGYKQGLTGGAADAPLLTFEEIAGAPSDYWPYQMAEVYLGLRSVDSLQSLDFSRYIPSYRRAIQIGRVVFSAVFDLSQGRTIDYARIESNLLQHRDIAFGHLAPLIKEWNARIKAR